MEAFYNETGIKVDLGNIRFTDSSFTSKTTFEIVDKDFAAKSVFEQKREKLEELLNNRWFFSEKQKEALTWGNVHKGQDGHKYVVIGYNPKARKNKLIIVSENNFKNEIDKGYVCSFEYLNLK